MCFILRRIFLVLLLLFRTPNFYLQKSFYAKVRKPRKHKKAKSTPNPEEIVSKHSGVLGLCSFVNAFPYDVPEFVPDILMVLSDHLHDPQPIPVFIAKKCSIFWISPLFPFQGHHQADVVRLQKDPSRQLAGSQAEIFR